MSYIRMKYAGIVRESAVEGTFLAPLIAGDEVVAGPGSLEDLMDGVLVEERGNPSNWFTVEREEFARTPREERRSMHAMWDFHAYVKGADGLSYVADMDADGDLIPRG